MIRRRRQVEHPAVLALLLSLAAGAGLAADDKDWRHERRELRHRLDAGVKVVIANPIGDLRVRAAVGEELVLIAHLQAPAGRRMPGLSMVPTKKELQIDVGAAAEPSRVDLTVLVAPDHPLVIEGEDDLVEVKGMEAAVQAQTDLGEIVVATSGPVQLESTQGTIRVELGKTDWSGISRVRSVTGEIIVRLPWQASVEVQMVGSGRIASDFTMRVEPTGQGVGKSAQAVVGEGGARLELQSERGDISLRRSFFPPGSGVARGHER